MTQRITGAELLVHTLRMAGVGRFFTLSGNQIMPIFDACIGEQIELVHVRHEAAAVHMADAWGRLTGQPGIALLTAGPGHANSLSAMYVALMAESPMLMLSGHAPRSQLGRGVFQEMAQAEMVGHVAKASWTATTAEQLGHDLARAFRMAKSGRPGPVHISLPVDLLETPLSRSARLLPEPDDFLPALSLLDIQTAEAVLTALSEATNPLLLAGPSMMRGSGRELLYGLAEATHMPVIATESPRGVNDPSLGAFAEVLTKADLIVLLGKKLDFTLCFADPPTVSSDCRFIQIDPEMRILEQTGRVLNESWRLILTALADPLPALERLLQLARATDWPKSEWFEEVQTAIRYRPAEWATLASSAEGPLKAVEVCRAVQEYLDGNDESVFISDGGEFGQWAQACLSAPHRVINGPAGSIGSAIPFAMAARLAFPKSRVVTMLGDGTFGFHAMEFDTAVRYELAFVAIIGNDACWNAERQIQLRQYGTDRLIGCDLLPSRYDEVVKPLGGYGESVTRPSQLRSALKRAGESNLPACVNVAIERTAAPVVLRNH